MATPFQLAASKIVVPASTRASLTARSSPDWRNRRRTRSGCGSSGRSSSAFTRLPAPAPAKPVPPLLCVLRRAYALAAACFARYIRIHVAPHSSRPSRKSVARTPSTISGRRESMIALVSPWLRADRHGERIDDHVLRRDPVVACDRDDLLRDLDAAVRFHRDVLRVREPD